MGYNITRSICIGSVYKHYPYILGDEIIVEGVWYNCRFIYYGDSPNEYTIRISTEFIPEFYITRETYDNNFMTVDEYREYNLNKLLNI